MLLACKKNERLPSFLSLAWASNGVFLSPFLLYKGLRGVSTFMIFMMTWTFVHI